MEPKKNSQNLLMIMMLTLLVFYTWSAFQMWMNPQKPKNAKQAAEAEKLVAEAKKGEPEKPAPRRISRPSLSSLRRRLVLWSHTSKWFWAMTRVTSAPSSVPRVQACRA